MAQNQIKIQNSLELSNINDEIIKIMRKIRRTYRHYQKKCEIEYHSLLCPRYCFSCKKLSQLETLARNLLFIKASFEVITAIINNNIVNLWKMWSWGFEPDTFIKVDLEGGTCSEFINTIKQKLEDIKANAANTNISKSAKREIDRIIKDSENVLDKIKGYDECTVHTIDRLINKIEYQASYEYFHEYFDS